jgi:hypothetical protein
MLICDHTYIYNYFITYNGVILSQNATDLANIAREQAQKAASNADQAQVDFGGFTKKTVAEAKQKATEDAERAGTDAVNGAKKIVRGE